MQCTDDLHKRSNVTNKKIVYRDQGCEGAGDSVFDKVIPDDEESKNYVYKLNENSVSSKSGSVNLQQFGVVFKETTDVDKNDYHGKLTHHVKDVRKYSDTGPVTGLKASEKQLHQRQSKSVSNISCERWDSTGLTDRSADDVGNTTPLQDTPQRKVAQLQMQNLNKFIGSPKIGTAVALEETQSEKKLVSAVERVCAPVEPSQGHGGVSPQVPQFRSAAHHNSVARVTPEISGFPRQFTQLNRQTSRSYDEGLFTDEPDSLFTEPVNSRSLDQRIMQDYLHTINVQSDIIPVTDEICHIQMKNNMRESDVASKRNQTNEHQRVFLTTTAQNVVNPFGKMMPIGSTQQVEKNSSNTSVQTSSQAHVINHSQSPDEDMPTLRPDILDLCNEIEHICPMCKKRFPKFSTSQNEFEEHVYKHFSTENEDYEVVHMV